MVRAAPALLKLKNALIADGWGPKNDFEPIGGYAPAPAGAIVAGDDADESDPVCIALRAADITAGGEQGDTAASAKKRSVLLNSDHGVQDAMAGMSIMMADLLVRMSCCVLLSYFTASMLIAMIYYIILYLLLFIKGTGGGYDEASSSSEAASAAEVCALL